MRKPDSQSRMTGTAFRSLATWVCGCAYAASLIAIAQEVDTSKLPPPITRSVDFAKDIQPILASRCYSCHGPDQQGGHLRWDVKANATKGGLSGPAFVPGRSAKSLVIHLVTGLDKDRVMPLAGDRLTGDEIGLLRGWIDQGAHWPEGLDPQDAAGQSVHWAYRPLSRPSLPELKDGSWARTPIDRFVLAKLHEKGLKPSPPADKRTLLRRITYDLTGLPPTPEQITAFLADEAPKAYERVVDHLLASPRYGERWARHWLDVVHYADSHGHDQDVPRDNAWSYRDYVIRSLNEDKPYARFAEEQLAGDVLYPGDPQATVATGFIATGPFDESSMRSTVDGTVDKKRAQSLDRDDMVMTTMSTFLSSTVHCARCHNHKFDPISQSEYYNLQAIFSAIDRAERPYDTDPKTHSQRQSLLKTRSNLEEKRQKLEESVAAITSPEIEHLDARIEALSQEFNAREKPVGMDVSKSLGYQSQITLSSDTIKWVQVDLGKETPIDEVCLVPVQQPKRPSSAFGFPARFRVDLSNDELFGSYHTVAGQTKSDFPNPGSTPYVIKNIGQAGRYVRVTALSPSQESSYWFFALAELAVSSKGENVAAGKRASSLEGDSVESPTKWGIANLVDGYTSTVSLSSLGILKDSRTHGYLSKAVAQPGVEKWVQVDLGKPVPIDEVRLLPALPKNGPDTPGFGFPLRFKIEVSNNSDFKARQMVFDQTGADYANPGNLPVVASGRFGPARYVRVTATLLSRGREDYVFALAELQVLSGPENSAFGSVVSALDSQESDGWSTTALVDNYTSREGIGDLATGIRSSSKRIELDFEIQKLKTERNKLAHSLMEPALRTELTEVNQRLTKVNQQLTSLPPPQMVYAAASDFSAAGSFHPSKGVPRPIHLLRRGEVTDPGELVSPGALSLISELEPDFHLESANNEGSRRAGLAKWISNPKNVLTWRSIVNRIWHYHFGRGIVNTPNDFGKMGGAPSHPELLDWLAIWFRENGGSLKQLHRLIVTSAVYLQSSQDNPQYSRVDADNQYLWRMNRSRLDAESVRDSVLQVTGKLDLTMGGPAAKQFYYQYGGGESTPLIDYLRFDVDSPQNFRRSVYRYVFRTITDPFMDSLDCPDSSQLSPARNTSTTPLQALTMWNNRFIVRQAEHLAERISKASNDLKTQLEMAYELALGRSPTSEEVADLQAYASRHGMANTCRVILNSNEFMFVN